MYNPATQYLTARAYAAGPAGAAGVRQAYNPYTGNWAQHAGATNRPPVMGSLIGRDRWDRSSGRASRRLQVGGSTGLGLKTSGGKSIEDARDPAAQPKPGPAAAMSTPGNDGNVYRKTDTGSGRAIPVAAGRTSSGRTMPAV